MRNLYSCVFYTLLMGIGLFSLGSVADESTSPPNKPLGQTDVYELNALLRLVDSDPSVRAAKQDAEKLGVDVDLVALSRSPTLDFTTRGRYPITSKIDSVQDRFSDLDERYVDGVFTVNVPLTDFGVSDAKKEAASLRAQAAALKINLVKQTTLAELLVMSLQVNSLNQSLIELQAILSKMQSRVGDSRMRYEGGTGALQAVRSLELKLVEIESRIMKAKYERDLLSQQFERRFDTLISEYLPTAVYFSYLLKSKGQFDVIDRDSQMMLQLELSALNFDALAVDRSRFPDINGSISATLFNVDSRLGKEYDVVGGISGSMPLVDAGSRDAQLRQIGLKQQIVDEELVMDAREAFAEWEAINTKRDEINADIESLGLKKASIAQDLRELELRAQTLEGKPTDLAVIEMEAGLTVVDELSLYSELQQSIIKSLVVSEQLLLEVLKQGQR